MRVRFLLTRSYPWVCDSARSTPRSTTSSPSRRSTWSTAPHLLAEMLAEGADHADVARRMREAEHAADETTHEIVKRVNSHLRDAVRPRGHLRARLRPRRRHGHDGRGRRPDPALRGRRCCPPELSDQVEVLQRCAELTADGDAAAAVDEVARGVLDRDQPARERRRQEPPAYPRQALQRRVQDASRCSSSRTSSSPSRRRSTRSRRSPTSSSRSRVKES